MSNTNTLTMGGGAAGTVTAVQLANDLANLSMFGLSCLDGHPGFDVDLAVVEAGTRVAAVLWSVDDAWRVSRPGHPDRAVQPGDVIDLDGWPLAIVAIPLRDAGQRRTVVGIAAPLRIEARFHTVRVLSDDRTPVVIGGLHGRILSELIALDGPVDWRVVAREVWDDDDEGLRRRWDVTLSRLRARLRSLGLRDDLVHADGAGHVELLLRPGDTTALVDG